MQERSLKLAQTIPRSSLSISPWYNRSQSHTSNLKSSK